MIQAYFKYMHSSDLAFHKHPFINCLKAFKATEQIGNTTLILCVPRVQNCKNVIFKKPILSPEEIGHFFPEYFNVNYLVQNPKSVELQNILTAMKCSTLLIMMLLYEEGRSCLGFSTSYACVIFVTISSKVKI